MSGYAAFTALLSLFPFLVFLTALAGFFGDEDVASRVLAGALEFAPQEVVDVLRPVIFEVLTQRHGGLLTVGIVFALWSASSGVEALRTILNRSYGAAETRPIWVLRPQSVVIVIFGAAAALLIASSTASMTSATKDRLRLAMKSFATSLGFLAIVSVGGNCLASLYRRSHLPNLEELAVPALIALLGAIAITV